jgi:glycosyltransferase involved in cell wall biosynthesis
MRIAQVAPLNCAVIPNNSRYATANIISDITEELVKRGHQVTLFATKDSKTKAHLESVADFAVKDEDFSQGDKKAGLSLSLYSYWQMAKVYRDSQRFDIIHTHYGNHGQIESIFFAPLLSVPTVSTIHCAMDEISRPVLREFNDVQGFVGISQNQLSGYEFLKDRFVNYHGVDMKVFKFNPDPQDHCVYVGRIDPQKGVDIAIDVAKKAKVNLKVIGFKPSGDQTFFEKIIKEIKENDFEFLEELSRFEVAREVAKAKALLFPIIWNEPFGLVSVEAMATGTPPIAFRKGSIPEIIEDGKSGFMVGTPEEMVSAIQKIHQIDRRECRKHVEENFTVEKMVDGYEGIYQKLIKKQ